MVKSIDFYVTAFVIIPTIILNILVTADYITLNRTMKKVKIARKHP